MLYDHPNRILMRWILSLALAALTLSASAQELSLDREIATVADAFTFAIVQHDSLAAATILDKDASILEGGAVESRLDYLAHHFHSDAAFLGSMERVLLDRSINRQKDVAWVLSTSRLTGTYRDRDIDLISVETLILVNDPEGWHIASVHWSSGAAPR